MLQRTKTFLRTTLIGGVIVILPSVILILAFKWLFGVVARTIEPLTNLAVDTVPLPERFNEPIATLIVLTVIILVCFSVGLFVRTRLGQIMYNGFEKGVLSRAPGYRMVKETVAHFIGRKESPFSSVVLVRLFGNDTLVTAFITDRHENGYVTIFAPTAPNPTSGFIYHVPAEYVIPVAVPIEDAMRSVISCGAGSEKLIKKMGNHG